MMSWLIVHLNRGFYLHFCILVWTGSTAMYALEPNRVVLNCVGARRLRRGEKGLRLIFGVFAARGPIR